MDDKKNKVPAAEKVPEKRNEKEYEIRRMNPVGILFLLISAGLFLVMLIFFTGGLSRGHNDTDSQTEKVKTIAVTGMNPGTDMVLHATESETQAVTEAPLDERKTEEELEKLFFGSMSSAVVSGRFTVSGLSSADRERTGFRESDFIKAASEFLSRNGIDTKRIDIQKEIRCSSEAVAYEAKIDGQDDKILSILFYQDFPGKYIFILQDAKTETLPVQTPQTEQNQTEALQSNIIQETERISVQTEAARENIAYDATRLSVTGIPKTLQNYLDNYYELQYGLYDYLYRNGYRDVKNVNVETYEIEAETKKATIYISLPDGNVITVNYNKEANSYSFQ